MVSTFLGIRHWKFVLVSLIAWATVPGQAANASSPTPHQGCLKVYQQGVAGFTCVYLTRLSGLVGEEFLTRLWVTANITETIEDGKARGASLYLPPPPRRLTGRFMNLDLCLPSDPKEGVLTMDQRSGRAPVKGYLGKNLIPGRILTDELLHHTTDVIRPDFPMDNLFLSSRMHCSYMAVSFIDGRYQLTGLILRSYAMASLHRTTVDGDVFSVTAFFGDIEHLPPIRAPISHHDVLVGKSDDFVLSMVTSAQSHSHIAQYMTLGLSIVFAELKNYTLPEMIKSLQDEMTFIEAVGGCLAPRLDDHFFNFFVKTIFVHFLTVRALDGGAIPGDWDRLVDVGCTANLLAELEFLRSMMGACFENLYVKGFESGTMGRLAARYATNLPAHTLSKLHPADKERVFSLFQLGSRFFPATPVLVSNLTEYVLDMYTSFTETFNLTLAHRRDLRRIYLVMWASELESGRQRAIDVNALRVFSACTAMCSNIEVASMVQALSRIPEQSIDVDKTFSPCFLSTRYDLTPDKVESTAIAAVDVTASEMEMGSLGFFNTLASRQGATLDRLPLAHCIHNLSDVLLVVPADNLTFVLSRKPIPGMVNYDINEVFLQNGAATAVAIIPADCARIPVHATQRLPIDLIPTLVAPRRGCPFCRSTLVSYDERDGLQSVATITNERVQARLLNKKSFFFKQDDMHIHYLLLLNNGTVVEVNSLYMTRAVDILVFSLFFISFCAGIFGVYRLVMFFH